MEFTVDFSVTENGKKSPEWTIDSDLDGEVSIQDLFLFVKRNLIVISDMALKEEQSQGFDKSPLVVVDGIPNKYIGDVSPLGKIEFVAKQQATELLLDLYDRIIQNSPVLTGYYRESNIVTYRGETIAVNREELKAWSDKGPEMIPGDIIRFINIAPYASMVEREGARSGGRLRRLGKSRSKDRRRNRGEVSDVVRMPNGAYWLALKSFKSKFKDSIKAYFEFVNGGTLGIRGGSTAPTTHPYTGKKLRYDFATPKRGRPRSKGPYTFPTIRIVITDGGTF